MTEDVTVLASADSGFRRLTHLLDQYTSRRDYYDVLLNRPDADPDDIHHLGREMDAARDELRCFVLKIADAIRREGGL
jgi:hypothetical protein